MRARSVVTWTALLSGFLACGELEEAQEVFERMPERNVVSWTAMIDGCARNGRPGEAFELFRRMMEENVRPNEFTLVALLIACSELGSLNLGRWVHEFAHKNGGFNRGVYVGTALIDMYSKCGSLEDAAKVFYEMPVRSVATWNSMLTGLGVHGHGREAIMLFKEMERENVRVDEVTLMGVMCACAREGMVDEGFKVFRDMRERYGIEPGIGHCNCLIEILNGEEIEIVKGLVEELDGWDRRMLAMCCREYGDSKMEEIVRSCERESDSFGCSLVQSEVECFQWEVG